VTTALPNRLPPAGPAVSPEPATLTQPAPQTLRLSGQWTALGLGALGRGLDALPNPGGDTVADATRLQALDTAGAWVLQALVQRWAALGVRLEFTGLRPEAARLMAAVALQRAADPARPPPARGGVQAGLERLGRGAAAAAAEALALLVFVGECALAAAGWLRHPGRMRWRPVLFNLRSAGADALPIVGLLSFLLGIVVAYQSADTLRQYGANVFIADIVGVAMLREFAPLIAAIIVAGRSGSAYAAQIGTMAVTEEIDALRTLGIAPLDLLVLPKMAALALALPLLTVWADLLGVGGGMVMASTQLDVGYGEFLDRFVKAVGVGTCLVGIGKAVVFAVIVAGIGCFQGFRTRGGADSVGRQTTRSVVQAIFGVIVADALFSVVFSVLDL
jgi:phospholipid/cholesterol/gamma-HCH transport system permease protein